MIGHKKSTASFLVSVLMVLLIAAVATAQNSSNSNSNSSNSNNSNNSNNNNNNNNNSGGYSNSGVIIDANGVLCSFAAVKSDAELRQLQMRMPRSLVPADLQARSNLRLFSLNRLEKAIQERGGNLTEEMRYLVGITRLKYVFFYEESGDIVLGGPAEPWEPGRDGALIGKYTGRPVLELQDLIVALRAYPPNAASTQIVGCSIDPTDEGLASMQRFTNEFSRNIRGEITPQQKVQFVNGVRQTLGYHDIRVDGVSPDTHLAQVLVAADYRMKLIGLEMERHDHIRLTTFIANADPQSVSRNSLTRWYFVPDYQCVKMTDDRTAMELVGDGVKLVEEAEAVSSSGKRSVSKSSRNRASATFVKSFTKNYPQIAKAAPVYAQLRNVIDMLVCAAHIQKEGFYEKSDWSMDYLGSEDRFQVCTYQIPERVASVATGVSSSNGRLFSAPVSGGVVIEAENALQENLAKSREKAEIQKTKNAVKLELLEGRWWWDAE